MGSAERLYSRLPVWGQNLAVTAYGVSWFLKRFGPGFRTQVEGLKARDRWSRRDLESWQRHALLDQLAAAAERVPFYRERWSGAEKRAALRGDLAALPLLEKGDLRGEERRFLRADMGNRLGVQTFYTSGSTGTPIATHWTLHELRGAMALREVRSAGWAGVSFAEPRATFSGRMVVPEALSGGPFYRLNRVERQVYFSAFHLSPSTAPAYVEALRRHGCRWLTGYGVSFYLLARFMLDQGLRPPNLAAVITTSEKITEPMRRVMEEAYGCPVFEEYSTVENISFASACEHGRLHVSPEAGVFEILRPDGARCDPGEPGEVVATGLLRRLQPMIRFRLGDGAAWDPDPCPCGRPFPVLREVLGRLEDVVEGPDGRRMVRFHGIFIDLPNVLEGQIIQESRTHLRVKVVASPGFGPEEEEQIRGRVHQRLGAEVRVDVERVDSIPRTSAGKFRAVVSKIGGETTGSPV